MKNLLSPTGAHRRGDGYFLIEVLVYIGVLVLLLGVGYAAMYRCLDSSVALRRNADDITSALHAGERWRADVRAANNPVRVEESSEGQLLHLRGPQGEITYRFATNSISRRLGTGGWVCLLPNVKASSMKADAREYATGWRWDLELQTRAHGSVKPGRVRPLFTFLAVPGRASNP